MKNTTNKFTTYSIGIMTMILIGFFLTGKIINIPQGTNQGGIISAIGVLVIIIFMSIVGFYAKLLWFDKKNIKEK